MAHFHASIAVHFLTHREVEVFRLIVETKPTRGMVDALRLTMRAVAARRASIIYERQSADACTVVAIPPSAMEAAQRCATL
jgi:FixJ family two-component response regulator